jgi:hypothetical protein
MKCRSSFQTISRSLRGYFTAVRRLYDEMRAVRVRKGHEWQRMSRLSTSRREAVDDDMASSAMKRLSPRTMITNQSEKGDGDVRRRVLQQSSHIVDRGDVVETLSSGISGQ